MKIWIQNGRLLDPATQTDHITDVIIESGLIRAIGKPPIGFKADRIIQAQEHWIFPGIVDLCCRPQVQHPQGAVVHTEALAAMKCGFSALCIPPDGDPILDTTANVYRLCRQSDEQLPQIYPIGALSVQLAGKDMADLTRLAEQGCIAFSQAQRPIQNLNMVRHCYDYAASFNLTVIIQPQDPWLSQHGVVHEGVVGMALGLPGIPDTAETVAVAQHLQLIRASRLHAHFSCLSSRESVELIRRAKADGLPVTADVAMHSLHLCDRDLTTFDPNYHVYPPIRSADDQHCLIAGIADGTIDAICSDHRPLDLIEKLAPFTDTTPGLSAIDTFLSLGLTLVQQQQLPLFTWLRAISTRPAQILDLPGGKLTIGAPADLCIFDPRKTWQLDDHTMRSKGKNSPFKHRALQGQIAYMILQGQVTYAA